MSTTIIGPDGKPRCRWCGDAPEFLHYHDTEWGFPVSEDHLLFEKLCLEGFQSGLSWRTILVKREGSLGTFIWRYEPCLAELEQPQTSSTSATSVALSKELKKQGWKFVGPTTVHAFMQAVGLINDQTEDCVIRAKADVARRRFKRPS